jgi:hypothetical protein
MFGAIASAGAHDSGEARVSNEALCTLLHRKERDVQYHAEQLAKAGLLKRFKRLTTRGVVWMWRVLAPWVVERLARLRVLEAQANKAESSEALRELGEAPAAAEPTAAAAEPLRRRLFTLKTGDAACIHHTPPCDECVALA